MTQILPATSNKALKLARRLLREGEVVAFPTDTLSLPVDTLATDSIPPKPVGDIKTTVHYTAKDSITLNMTSKNVNIYGNATINYNPIVLDA